MARLWSSGFELNSTSTGVEWTTTSGSPTIQTSTVRSGTYAGQITSLVSVTAKYFEYQFSASDAAGPFYFRFAFRYATAPSANNQIFRAVNTANNVQVMIRLTSTGTLQLCNSAASQIGSDSSALTSGTWYYVEVLADASHAGGSQILTARLNGTQFATSSAQSNLSIAKVRLGGNLAIEAQTTGNWFFDDVAINDTTGSNDTSWPGDGHICHAHGNANGDNTGFGSNPGVAAGSEYTSANEVTPDDQTSERFAHTALTDDWKIGVPSEIGASDTINFIAVGFRFAVDNVGGTLGVMNARIKATSGGTVTAGSNQSPNHQATSYQTNQDATPHNYTLTSYVKPGTSSAWTQSDLSTTQIGMAQSNNPTNTPRYTTVWALIEYVPAAAGGSAPPNWPVMTGRTKFWGPRYS